MNATKDRPTCSTCPHAIAKAQDLPDNLTCEVDPPVPVNTATVRHQDGHQEETRTRWMQPKVSPSDSCARHPERQKTTAQS